VIFDLTKNAESDPGFAGAIAILDGIIYSIEIVDGEADA
jgi:hypothetical protein